MVIGAMSPDFHYFFAMAVSGKVSHTVAGAFYYDLPIAFVALCLFHWVLKLPLISLAPHREQTRLARFATPFRLGPPKRLLLILLSLLAGIFSHLLWDSFTHGRGWMVHHLAILRTIPFQDFGSYRPLFNWLQHVSTALGIVALVAAYMRWSRDAEPQAVPERLRLSARVKMITLGLIGSAATIFAVLYGLDESRHSTHLSVFAMYASVSFVTLTGLGLLAFSLYWHSGSRPTSSAA